MRSTGWVERIQTDADAHCNRYKGVHGTVSSPSAAPDCITLRLAGRSARQQRKTDTPNRWICGHWAASRLCCSPAARPLPTATHCTTQDRSRARVILLLLKRIQIGLLLASAPRTLSAGCSPSTQLGARPCARRLNTTGSLTALIAQRWTRYTLVQCVDGAHRVQGRVCLFGLAPVGGNCGSLMVDAISITSVAVFVVTEDWKGTGTAREAARPRTRRNRHICWVICDGPSGRAWLR